ncbi:hypothetical protein ACFQYP_51035 [Nonomuraea antimicrobica]|uniref:hypothetical protein n=1 Tax=Nonomuraea antimicrobica TaxID=561173 RepID=UPI0031E57C93
MLVLLLNDHLLKPVWPGFVTGKLSDVAGLVVAPPLVALLCRRRADLAATVLTGALFTLVKTTETGAEAASHAWTYLAGPSRVLADPTDLLALPALALAWWVRGHSLRHPSSARWRVVVTMPLAVLAVTATSGMPLPPSAEAVEVDRGGRIHVQTDGMTALASDDGGSTWSEVSGDRDRRGQSAQCVPGAATRCYQVVQGRMGVEQSDDGGRTWRPAWQLSADDQERVNRRHDRRGELRSMALGVQARPGGHVVVVANGLDGIVVRDTSGTWRHVGWPGAEPAAVDVDREWRVAVFLAACMLFGGAGAGLRRYSRSYTGFALAACLGLLPLLGTGPDFPFVGTEELGLYVIGLLAVLTGTTVCFALAVAGRARPVPAAVGLLTAPLVYASAYLPFAGWAEGTPDSYWLATALAVLLTALVLLASAVAVRNDARRANPYFDGASTSSPT